MSLILSTSNAVNDLLYPASGSQLVPYGTSFSVGAANILVYGSPLTMAFRSTFMRTLLEGHKSELDAATPTQPFRLLPEATGFESGVTSSFKCVWNHLNGMTTDTGQLVLHQGLFSLHDKYTVILLIVQLGVGDDKYLGEHLRDFFETCRMISTCHRDDEFMQRLLSLRPYIQAALPDRKDQQQTYEFLASLLTGKYRSAMLFGPVPSLVPRGHHEISPTGDSFDHKTLKEAKNLWVCIYSQTPSVHDSKVFVPGVHIVSHTVAIVGQATAERLTRTTKINTIRVPAECRKECFTANNLSYEAAYDYHTATGQFLLLSVETPTGNIAVMEGADRKTWLCPTLGLNGLKATQSGRVRFFSA